MYGKELILDLSDCDPTIFTRGNLSLYFEKAAEIADMELALEPYFWDEKNGGETDEPYLKGVSAFHFIETSNIVIHTLTMLKCAFINFFSCKDFNEQQLIDFTVKFFKSKTISHKIIIRGEHVIM